MEHNPEKILLERINRAVSEQNDGELLENLNEYIGLLRELGRYEEAYKIGDSIITLMDKMELYNTVSYATGMLNIATAYRAGGRLKEALELYDRAAATYSETIDDMSMLWASLHNNRALAYQELGDIEASMECLSKALSIAEGNDAKFEMAVTLANMANSNYALGRFEDAIVDATDSIEIFDDLETKDAHYAAALYALGEANAMLSRTDEAADYLSKALSIVEREAGKTPEYFRIKAELDKLLPSERGLDICRRFYEANKDKFKEHKAHMAVGLVGRGSDCFGYDDAVSRDHDWGPGFLIWVTKDYYDKYGKELEEAYNSLPDSFENFNRAPVVSGHKRRGVFVIEDFYKDLLGKWPLTEDDYLVVKEYELATAVNGEVYSDPEGIFTEYRNELLEGYPRRVLLLKIAETVAAFTQTLQYNMGRATARGDKFTAEMFKADGLKAAMKLAHLIENEYAPHDKWLYRSTSELEMGKEIIPMLNEVMNGGTPDILGAFFAQIMYEKGFISDVDDYIDHHVPELLYKAELEKSSTDELVGKIVALEFEAFDKVENEGGRASCQDDFFTFDIMRKSQYMTWTRDMLIQYLYDFDRELKYGHNLITEKYGRMMESTAPLEYEKLKENFPLITPEKKQIIETIVAIQVGWMEAFAAEYPKLAGKARSIHTYEDNPYNTSYETYLRGEISTYSDKMLELYGRFIAGISKEGGNLAYRIMENTVHLYGYDSFEKV